MRLAEVWRLAVVLVTKEPLDIMSGKVAGTQGQKGLSLFTT